MAKRSFYVKDSELDDYQVKVINKKTDNSYIVKGCAGSGKSILALWKAKQIQDERKGSYLYVVYTKALRQYMSDGIKQVGLRESNVANFDACFQWGRDDNGKFERGAWKKGSYDYIIVDTPPALGILTINALTACTGAIIPAQADIYSLQGIGQLNSTIETVKKYCNPSLSIMGIVITRFNGRSIIRREVAEMLEHTADQLHTKLFSSKIRECTALVEAQATKQNIYSYAPRSNATADYKALVDEIIKGE